MGKKVRSSVSQSREKIVPLIDNCSANSRVESLTDVNLIFLPPNATSVLQPIDQRVIKSSKAYYSRKIVRVCFKALDKNMSLPKITLPVKILSSSRSELSGQTIIYCFRKARISDSRQQLAQCDVDDPFNH